MNLVILSLLIYGQLNSPESDLWVLLPYFAFVGFLANRARRLKRRVADLVDVAAHRVGLQPIQRAGVQLRAGRGSSRRGEGRLIRSMPLQRLLRFLFALVAEIGLLAALISSTIGRWPRCRCGLSPPVCFAGWRFSSRPVTFRLASACGSKPRSSGRWPSRCGFSPCRLEPGDDFWRYQWEGKIQQAGFNPYTHAPDAPALEALREEFPAWHRINHRHFRTIYPPGAELVFLALSGSFGEPAPLQAPVCRRRPRDRRRPVAACCPVNLAMRARSGTRGIRSSSTALLAARISTA